MRLLGLAPFLIASPVLAEMSQDIGAACRAATTIAPDICSCMGELAIADLTPDEQAFVLASIREDAGAAQTLRDTLAPDSLTRASVFLINAPATCAAG